MAFRVGQKVVCVDGSPGRISNKLLLERGQIYTISELIPYPYGDLPDGVFVSEVHCPNELGFIPSRFRPVAERSTDISIFTAMLNPSKQTVDAR